MSTKASKFILTYYRKRPDQDQYRKMNFPNWSHKESNPQRQTPTAPQFCTVGLSRSLSNYLHRLHSDGNLVSSNVARKTGTEKEGRKSFSITIVLSNCIPTYISFMNHSVRLCLSLICFGVLSFHSCLVP